MTSIYSEDDPRIGRAKRSKSGSLKPRISTLRTKKGPAKPQAMVKVAGWANQPGSVKRMLDYISRTLEKEADKEAVVLETEDGVEREGRLEVGKVFDEWKPDFKRKTRDAKTLPRHAAHIVFSAKADLTRRNVEKTLSAARRTLTKHVGDKGYKFAIGVHQDGKYPHVHAIVKADSTKKNQTKLRLGPQALFEIRKTLAKELTREGLEHVATRQKKKARQRPSNFKTPESNQLDRTQAVIGRLSKEQRQFERALNRPSPKVDAFRHREQQAKALATLRTQVKDDRSLNDTERKKAFNLIRGFKRKIEKKGIDEEKELAATVKIYEDRCKKWSHDFKKCKKGSGDDTELGRVLKAGKSLQREIQRFKRQGLGQANLSVAEKKKAFNLLRSQELVVTKTLSLSKKRGR